MKQSSIDLNKIKKELSELSFNQKPFHREEVIKYLNFYEIFFPEFNQYIGTFESQGYKISGSLFIPKNNKYNKIVIIMHGYLDHTGILKNLIKHLLNNNCAVAAYDMPGHGLSSGELASIGSFKTYAYILSDFIKIIKNNFNKPIDLIAHSTGCSVVYEYLTKHNDKVFDKVIFLAPLIRPKYWNSKIIKLFLYEPFIKSVVRKFRNNSSNKDFLNFQKNIDPFQAKRIPLRWVKALLKWNEKLNKYPVINDKVLMIQGKKDVVIDWKYNIKYLRNKLPKSQLVFLKEANHHLVNESNHIQENVFELINEYLNENSILPFSSIKVNVNYFKL